MFDLFVELMELSPISRSKPRKRESKSRSELSNSGETTASIPADLAISNVSGLVFPLSLIRTNHGRLALMLKSLIWCHYDATKVLAEEKR